MPRTVRGLTAPDPWTNGRASQPAHAIDVLSHYAGGRSGPDQASWLLAGSLRPCATLSKAAARAPSRRQPHPRRVGPRLGVVRADRSDDVADPGTPCDLCPLRQRGQRPHTRTSPFQGRASQRCHQSHGRRAMAVGSAARRRWARAGSNAPGQGTSAQSGRRLPRPCPRRAAPAPGWLRCCRCGWPCTIQMWPRWRCHRLLLLLSFSRCLPGPGSVPSGRGRAHAAGNQAALRQSATLDGMPWRAKASGALGAAIGPDLAGHQRVARHGPGAHGNVDAVAGHVGHAVIGADVDVQVGVARVQAALGWAQSPPRPAPGSRPPAPSRWGQPACPSARW